MPAAEKDDRVLALPERFDAAAVARLFRTQARAARLPEALDFGAVKVLDSSAVAFVRALAALATSRGTDAPRLLNTSARYADLCRAHREPTPANGD